MIEIIPMIEVEKCLICGTFIGKGNDPAICKKIGCKEIFDFETEFNKFVKKQTEEKL